MAPKCKNQTPSKDTNVIKKSHQMKTNDSTSDKEDDDLVEKDSKGKKTVHDLEQVEKKQV